MFLPRAVRVYVATGPCNLRRSFDGLSNEVREVLKKDPLCPVGVKLLAGDSAP